MKPVFTQQIKKLLKEAEQNSFTQARRWVFSKTISMKAYIRITSHWINGGHCRTIDIANVEVFESNQRQGYFTRLLSTVEEVAKQNHRAVYIEEIMLPWLYKWLQTRDYQSVPGHPQSLVKLFPLQE
jgi:GNAT superfamily N-acetyltransferase